jgi:renalase
MSHFESFFKNTESMKRYFRFYSIQRRRFRFPNPHHFRGTMNLLESAPHIAIIGAGMAGLSYATALRDARCAVTVFERSQRPAGGMSTRQDGDWQCDHGAQYFTARDPWFRAEVARWIQAGAAAMWEPRLAVFDGTMHPVYPARTEKLERLVGTPSMTSPADLLASSLTVRTQSNIVELRR